MPKRINDLALIGDLETAAVIDRDGSIEWLCLPRFDSAACFAALLGGPDNGRWKIAPTMEVTSRSRRYTDGSLVLETEFETADGAATLIDFMPPRDDSSDLIRIVVGRRGTVEFDFDLAIRFDYGRTVPWVSRLPDGRLTAIAGPDLIVLQAPVELHGEDMHTRGKFTVKEGDRLPFVMAHLSSIAAVPEPVDAEAALEATLAYWRDFAAKCRPAGRWSDLVQRSLITLKALTYGPTGGIVAAATTSLPEAIGGPRNWDYRYCWVRDATVTLLALMKLGYFEEASAWRDWLLRAVAGDPAQMQIMYGLAGERRLAEWEVPWLSGFRDSRPVRIGNAAAGQLQIDIYGELSDALAQAREGGLPPHPRAKAIRATYLKHLQTIWDQPDEGIWEFRGPRRHFVHSKVMAWVSFDRAAKEAEADGADKDARHWRRVADAVHAEVCAKGFDSEIGSFVQSYGSQLLDASLLQIALVGFLPATDWRVEGTIKAIEARLMRNGLLLRYETDHTDDGLPPGEGAFLACSFWLADNYVLCGRTHDARALFAQLVGYCNDVGLLAEEVDPVTGEMLGNFPQAFSHVGLINTALNLSQADGPAVKRSSC